jgi:DNA-binding beta-propeller fold protein YncE
VPERRGRLHGAAEGSLQLTENTVQTAKFPGDTLPRSSRSFSMFRFSRSPAGIGAAGLALALGLAGVFPAAAQVYTYQSTLGATGSTGSNNSHFNNPVAGSVDTVNGHFFVGDVLNQRIQVFDTTSLAVVATIGVTGVTGSDNAHFNQPAGAGFDPTTGRLFIADSGNNRVQVLDAKTLAYVATIGATGLSGSDNGHFNGPVSARVNVAAHQLYVTDGGNNRVQVFDSGTFAYVGTLGTSGVSGRDNAHFNAPEDAEFNPTTNEIMVADQGNQRVQRFDAATLNFVATLGGAGFDPGGNMNFTGPVSVAFDPGANLLIVADAGANERVQVFNAQTYQFVQTLGTTGSGGLSNNQFFGPLGIGVDQVHGHLFIGDALNERVQVFSAASTASHASVLPGSRAVQLGNTATIFATMINAGSAALDGCAIGLPVTAPAGLTLSYQTTNAANVPVGTPNMPVTIAGNDGIQSFVVSFQSTSAFEAPSMALDFSCAGAAPAGILAGIDTVDLTFSATPIADIIALAATATNNGIVEVRNGGAGAFAVATDNLGASAPLTVSVDTGAATLPVTATICPSNPSTGACLSAPAASFPLTIAGGTTPTFSIFINSAGAVPFDPAGSRIFVRFTDAQGGLHGSTSVAIETV